jgi:glycosyltransferase involved in cell wall biosynthesis
VNPRDVEALAGALHRLANHRELREELARKGRERVATFTWEKAVRETWDVYRNVLAAA